MLQNSGLFLNINTFRRVRLLKNIYLFEREREHALAHRQEEQQTEGEGEAGSSQRRKPSARGALDPRTLGS